MKNEAIHEHNPGERRCTLVIVALRRALLHLVLCGGFLGLLASPAQADPLPLHIHGNLVMNEEVYLALLELPEDAKANAETARWIQHKLLRFLHHAGYVLATVQVKVLDSKLDVEINEGVLDKVIFLGAGSLRTIMLKLDLAIPDHVFNQPSLERQLLWLAKRYNLPPITYKLVLTQKVVHHGPQLDKMESLPGGAMIQESGRYELQISLSSSDWGTGLGFDLEYNFPDGLALGLSYSGKHMIFKQDRWRVGGLLGAQLLQHIENGDTFLSLSHAILDFRWYTPPLIGKGFRPFLWLNGDMISRQRRDLDVDLFYSARLSATLNLGYEIVHGMTLSVGGGVEEKFVFGMERVGTNPPPLEIGRWLQPLMLGRADLVFNPNEPRDDRLHRLLLDLRYYLVDQRADFGKASYQYQFVAGLGWHDLIVSSRGAWLFPGRTVPFDEEEPVGGRYVRGVFGGLDYVHEVVNLTLEFRLSLVRDLFKLSVFNDLAGFGRIDRTNGNESFMLADSFGLGFHALIFDTLQLNLYYAFGLDMNRTFDHGLAASLSKVY